MLRPYAFNRHALRVTGTIKEPHQAEISATLGLINASLDDALRYGGNITREAIGAMNLRHDRKYIVVDTKVHMLMAGMSPAIPGWHTDGAPRDATGNPQGSGPPDQFAQCGDLRPPRYHLLVTGTGCLTKFVGCALTLEIPEEPTRDLYAHVSRVVRQANPPPTITVPSCSVVEFDWHDLHTGVIAAHAEWRYLIRVTETDYLPPCSDLRRVIRTQQNVYIPTDFGW